MGRMSASEPFDGPRPPGGANSENPTGVATATTFISVNSADVPCRLKTYETFISLPNITLRNENDALIYNRKSVKCFLNENI